MPEAEKEKVRKMRADHKKKKEQAKLASVTAAVKDKQDISEKALIAALHKVAKASGDDSKDRTITFKLAAAKTQS